MKHSINNQLMAIGINSLLDHIESEVEKEIMESIKRSVPWEKPNENMGKIYHHVLNKNIKDYVEFARGFVRAQGNPDNFALFPSQENWDDWICLEQYEEGLITGAEFLRAFANKLLGK